MSPKSYNILNSYGIIIKSIEPKKILEIVSEENPLIVTYTYYYKYKYNYDIFHRTLKSFKEYFGLYEI